MHDGKHSTLRSNVTRWFYLTMFVFTVVLAWAWVGNTTTQHIGKVRFKQVDPCLCQQCVTKYRKNISGSRLRPIPSLCLIHNWSNHPDKHSSKKLQVARNPLVTLRFCIPYRLKTISNGIRLNEDSESRRYFDTHPTARIHCNRCLIPFRKNPNQDCSEYKTVFWC